MCVIHDPVNLMGCNAQAYGGVWSPCVDVTPQNDHDGFTIHLTQSQLPWHRPPFVIAKVWRVCQWPRERVGYPELGVGTNQFAEAIPISAIEALDIELQYPDIF